MKQRTLGINFSAGEASVKLWAPRAGRVMLHNETTGKTLELQSVPEGYWVLQSRHIKPDDCYTFSLDGGRRRPDPASLSQPLGVHDVSQALDLGEFPWTDSEWRNPALGDYIIYELHTGAFSEAGNFPGISGKLDYLRELGVNAIELMPVAQFPGRHNWGYDGVFPFAVHNGYGGARALQEFVNTCHMKGFSVILDVVYNHLGPEGNCLDHYGPYFTEKYKSPWGAAINFDNAYSDPVREYYIENALMWLRDFHMDALRLDAVHAINDQGPVHILREMSREVALLKIFIGQEKYLIAESNLNDSRYIRGPEQCGYGMDAQWSDDFHHSLRVAAGQEALGYYADFNGLCDLETSVRDGYVYTGQYAHERKRRFGTKTTGISGDHFIVFSQNHDQVGNQIRGARTAHVVSYPMQQLLAASVILSPFIPLLFMGEEWGASSPFPYFTEHSDPELIRQVASGRKAEFASFQNEEPFPANEELTFIRARLIWEERAKDPHAALLNFYKYLIVLRQTFPSFKNYDRSSVSVYCEAEKEVLVVVRSFKEQRIYCLYNFSRKKHTVHLAPSAFPLRLLLDSFTHTRSEVFSEDLEYYRNGPVLIQPETVILLANVPA